jgi:hypothetical protein
MTTGPAARQRTARSKPTRPRPTPTAQAALQINALITWQAGRQP